jgi:hypothetical protein
MTQSTVLPQWHAEFGIIQPLMKPPPILVRTALPPNSVPNKPMPATGDIGPSGLVGRWKFDDGSGTSAIDSSGYNYTGTLVGTPVWTSGQLSGALQFNATNYVTFPVNTPLANDTASTSLCAWFNTSNATAGTILAVNNAPIATTPTAWDALLYVDTSGHLRGGGDLASGFPTIVSPSTVNDGAWHHTVLTYDGANLILYLDGANVSSQAGVRTGVGTPCYWVIGTGYTQSYPGGAAGWYSFTGKIDDVRVYTRVLTPTEVSQLCNFRG